jgi:hypothetical protein
MKDTLWTTGTEPHIASPDHLTAIDVRENYSATTCIVRPTPTHSQSSSGDPFINEIFFYVHPLVFDVNYTKKEGAV